MKKIFKKVVIIGPGLIGGSIGSGLIKNKMAKTIVGVARHLSTLKKAKRVKAINDADLNIIRAVQDADLIILAVPVSAIKKIIYRIKDALKSGCILFDVGSTKREVVDIAEKYLPKNVFFVGTHPMAGAEKVGVEFASKHLFNQAICFVTKTKKTNHGALETVVDLWRSLGAHPIIVTPYRHDKIVSQISHLPHLISVALTGCVNKNYLKFAATGFKDTTRIAAGDEKIWHDISFSNRRAIVKAISRFEKYLARITDSIKKSKKLALIKIFRQAKKKRESIK